MPFFSSWYLCCLLKRPARALRQVQDDAQALRAGGRTLSRPPRLILTPRQVNNITQVSASLKDFRPTHVLADKGSGSWALVTQIETAGAQAVIPPPLNQIMPVHAGLPAQGLQATSASVFTDRLSVLAQAQESGLGASGYRMRAVTVTR